MYLKNESVIRGRILQRDDKLVKIQTQDGSIWSFPSADIVRTASEPSYSNFHYKPRGYANFTELGPLVAGKTTIDGVTTAAFSFQSINGYRFHQYAFAGVGVGVDLYATQTIIPLFASIRGDFARQGTILPFYFVEAGNGFNITQNSSSGTDFKGGLLYAGGIGVKIPFNRSSGFLISFGYRHQSTSYLLNGDEKKISYNRLAIRAGFFL
ncbi:MAG: hypothetical protein H7Y03_02745 [Chitinophagaceae bacterium]|nr:hypothetical protein [Chitinophagaceae bacterium]